MASFYADRGILNANGVQLVDIKTINLSNDRSITRASHMTRNRVDSGYKAGNKIISGSFEQDIPELSAPVDLINLPDDADLTFSFEFGGERLTVLGVIINQTDHSASVGDVSKTVNFQALDIVNENGTSVNALIG